MGKDNLISFLPKILLWVKTRVLKQAKHDFRAKPDKSGGQMRRTRVFVRRTRLPVGLCVAQHTLVRRT